MSRESPHWLRIIRMTHWFLQLQDIIWCDLWKGTLVQGAFRSLFLSHGGTSWDCYIFLLKINPQHRGKNARVGSFFNLESACLKHTFSLFFGLIIKPTYLTSVCCPYTWQQGDTTKYGWELGRLSSYCRISQLYRLKRKPEKLTPSRLNILIWIIVSGPKWSGF